MRNEEMAPEVVENSGVGTYVFKKAAKIDGEEVKSINYDLTQLSGATVRKAKSELQKRGYTVAVKELDECFHAALFAEAAGVSYADIERLSVVDYNAVADIARDFMNGED